MTDRAPRERLLTAAAELFGRAGVASVGVSRVIERAEVGQMSLWRTFGSKRGLVEAWLRQVDAADLAEMREAAATPAPPRERLEKLIDVYYRRASDPDFAGCPLVRAAAEPEAVGPVAGELARAHKEAVWALFIDLCRSDGVIDAESLATALLYLLEGAGLAAGIRAATPLAPARAAALQLFDDAPRRPVPHTRRRQG